MRLAEPVEIDDKENDSRTITIPTTNVRYENDNSDEVNVDNSTVRTVPTITASTATKKWFRIDSTSVVISRQAKAKDQFAPYQIAYKYSSCIDGWNPINIYRYSLAVTFMWIHTIYAMFLMMWGCYCGSGRIEDGAPICCIYICCEPCRQSCQQATHVEINTQICTIL
ncbi:hypothetical protein I4U23_023473 [Adineta vaga]|nr:hypothetical protein I4U23_023473 [Adineta vaga]